MSLKWPEPENLVGPNQGEEKEVEKVKEDRSAPPVPTVGNELAGVLAGKSEAELKKIFGGNVPDGFLTKLKIADKVDVDGIETQGLPR